MKKKQFYGDVVVVERRKLRICFTADEKPDPKQMLEMLEDQAYDDILDEECLEYEKVVSIDVDEDEQEEDLDDYEA